MEKNEIIDKLESLKEDLDTLIWCISDKSSYTEQNLTVNETIKCYANMGKEFDETFNLLLDKFGNEKLIDFINKD